MIIKKYIDYKNLITNYKVVICSSFWNIGK